MRENWLCWLPAQTNMAIAIQRYPDIVKLIKRVYIMGGCLVGGNMTADPNSMPMWIRRRYRSFSAADWMWSW